MSDQSRDEAQARSRNCEHCSGSGQAIVFDPDYTGRRVVDRQVIRHGEITTKRYAMVVSAHCICPMGRWLRSRTERETMDRIPDLADILAGRSRWLANDPTGLKPFDPGVRDGSERKAVVRVKDGRPVT